MTDTPADTPAPLPPPTLPPPAAPAPAEPAPVEPVPVEAAPAQSSPRKPWVKWLIPAGVVVIALVLVLVFVAGGDDGPGTPKGTAQAATALAAVIDGADLADSTFAEIECPVDFSGVLAMAPTTSDIADVDGEGAFSAVLQPDGSPVRLIECSFEGDGGRLAGLSLGGASATDGFQAAMESFVPNHKLTFDEPQSWRGGTLYTYCGVPTDAAAEDGFDEFCEADWVTDDLVVGLFTSPILADQAQVRAWLDASLAPIIAELAEG